MAAQVDGRRSRDDARDARQRRTRGQKKIGAFKARIEDIEGLARVLARNYGLSLSAARHMAFRANPIREQLSKRGQPPSTYELYEGVEVIRNANKGKLPTGGKASFWTSFLQQWNAFYREERPELMYPDWHTLASTYHATRRRVQRATRAALAKARLDKNGASATGLPNEPKRITGRKPRTRNPRAERSRPRPRP